MHCRCYGKPKLRWIDLRASSGGSSVELNYTAKADVAPWCYEWDGWDGWGEVQTPDSSQYTFHKRHFEKTLPEAQRTQGIESIT